MEMGTKTKKKLSENILEKFSMDFLRNQVLKNAYGNDDTVIAKLDPRILIVWYLFFGLVPWFVNDLWFLMACFLLVVVTTKLARVAGLVLLVSLPFAQLRDLFDQYPVVVGGAHPYREGGTSPSCPGNSWPGWIFWT